MIIWTVYIVGGVLSLLLLFLVIFLLQGPPFVPISDQNLEEMIAVVKKYKPKRILDMGSGDGKLVIGLAQHGFTADGVEINPLLVRRSKQTAKREKVKNVRFYRANFWQFDVSSYDMIVLYVVNLIMPKLEKKLRNELKPGTIVISKFAEFPGLKTIERTDQMRVYRIPEMKANTRHK